MDINLYYLILVFVYVIALIIYNISLRFTSSIDRLNDQSSGTNSDPSEEKSKFSSS